MKEKILTRHILEGLIHNLNNPLNLILGYSHILRKAQPDNAEIAKICQAGIRMDEVLKELYNRISERSFELIQEISLASWLTRELDYLQHYLSIKHGIRFVREDLTDDQVVLASLIELGTWYESKLVILNECFEAISIQTGISSHLGKPALYLKPDQVISNDIASSLSEKIDLELYPADKQRIESIWMEEQNTLIGVIG